MKRFFKSLFDSHTAIAVAWAAVLSQRPEAVLAGSPTITPVTGEVTYGVQAQVNGSTGGNPGVDQFNSFPNSVSAYAQDEAFGSQAFAECQFSLSGSGISFGQMPNPLAQDYSYVYTYGDDAAGNASGHISFTVDQICKVTFLFGFERAFSTGIDCDVNLFGHVTVADDEVLGDSVIFNDDDLTQSYFPAAQTAILKPGKTYEFEAAFLVNGIAGDYGGVFKPYSAISLSPAFDADVDGDTDADDIDYLVANPYDVNGDGNIDQGDIDDTFDDLNTWPGDFNLDGKVDFNDYLILQNNFGMPGTYSQGDADFSGFVDFNDYLILQNNFGLGT